MSGLTEMPSRTPTLAAAPPNLLFLRRFCTSLSLGRGVCTYEDDEVSAKAYVIMSITFENGRTLTGGRLFFAGLGVRFTGEALIDLPLERARLNDHHGAVGWGCCERAAVAVLREQGRWAA